MSLKRRTPIAHLWKGKVSDEEKEVEKEEEKMVRHAATLTTAAMMHQAMVVIYFDPSCAAMSFCFSFVCSETISSPGAQWGSDYVPAPSASAWRRRRCRGTPSLAPMSETLSTVSVSCALTRGGWSGWTGASCRHWSSQFGPVHWRRHCWPTVPRDGGLVPAVQRHGQPVKSDGDEPGLRLQGRKKKRTEEQFISRRIWRRLMVVVGIFEESNVIKDAKSDKQRTWPS